MKLAKYTMLLATVSAGGVCRSAADCSKDASGTTCQVDFETTTGTCESLASCDAKK